MASAVRVVRVSQLGDLVGFHWNEAAPSGDTVYCWAA